MFTTPLCIIVENWKLKCGIFNNGMPQVYIQYGNIAIFQNPKGTLKYLKKTLMHWVPITCIVLNVIPKDSKFEKQHFLNTCIASKITFLKLNDVYFLAHLIKSVSLLCSQLIQVHTKIKNLFKSIIMYT